MLKHLKSVYVAFKPGDATATSARELLQRISGDRAKKSNPSCKIDFKADEELPAGGAFVELLFTDDDKRKVTTADKDVASIQRIIDRKGAEMELRGVFKEVGHDPWKAGSGSGVKTKK